MSNCFCTKTYQCLRCEKAVERKLQSLANRRQASCGTRGGYNRHLRLKEPTCNDCRAAQKVSVQQWQLEAKYK